MVDGARVDEAKDGDEVSLIVNQTPCYGESGGQEGDRGVVSVPGGGALQVTETLKKLGDLHVHQGKLSGGNLKVGDEVHLVVDSERRTALRGHHSATHLLHEALRRNLGDHVSQKGSLVAGERLRFDISHPKAVTSDELAAVEEQVNNQIRKNTEVTTRLMTPDEAIEAGAMALFGEKYGDEVRVVSMGSVGGAEGNQAFSVELCGGTHARRTGDIGLFKILSEGAVAAGVRRIEAVTGPAAEHVVTQQENALAEAAALLKVTPEKVAERVENLMADYRKLEKELTDVRRQMATGGGGGDNSEVKEVGGVKFSGKTLDGVPAKDLKSLVDDIKGQIGSGVVALISTNDGKASLVVGVTDDLTGTIDAVELVRAGSAAVGGKGGGGRPDMAQAGGPDGSNANEAIAAIEQALEQI